MTTGNSTSRGSRTFAKRCRWTLEAGNPSDKGLARSGADLSPSSTTHHQKSSVSAGRTDGRTDGRTTPDARKTECSVLRQQPPSVRRPNWNSEPRLTVLNRCDTWPLTPPPPNLRLPSSTPLSLRASYRIKPHSNGNHRFENSAATIKLRRGAALD